MDAQQFLAEFGHIASAPGGIKQIREMIYQLAITGKLTAQTDSEGDAHTQIADISAHRNRLIREKRCKRLPKLESKALDIPKSIELPPSWCWTRLLDIGEISPRNDASDDAQASFIPMSGVPRLHMGKLAFQLAKWGDIKKGFTHFASGDVVIAKITPCFENGKAAVIDGLEHTIGAGTTELHVFRPIHSGVLSGYVYLFLRSPYFAIEGEQNMTGTAGQKRLPTDYFATRALPLPPTEEQSRIVAKVDELMALCDKLEAQQQDRRRLQNNLRQSTLQAVANANSPHELQTSWARLVDNFGRLFQIPEDVAELRTEILELAVRGALTVQRQAELPISDLVQFIARREVELKGARKSKFRDLAAEITEAECPFPLPPNWAWARLGDVGFFLGGGTPRKSEPAYWGGGIPWVSPKDMKAAYIEGSKDSITQKAVDESATKIIPEESLLVVVRGMILAHSFPVGIAKRKLTINQDMKALCPYLPEMSEFLLLLLSASKRRLLGLVERSTHGTCRLETEKLATCVIGIPPLAEQQRIVEQVSELQGFCDSLESQLRQANELAGRLALAAISSITGITTEQEEEPMKAPQTELISPLRLGKAPDIKAQAPLATILARHQGEMPAKDLWQRFSGEIDAFYAQLKTEVAHGWIVEPAVAEMREKRNETTSA